LSPVEKPLRSHAAAVVATGRVVVELSVDVVDDELATVVAVVEVAVMVVAVVEVAAVVGDAVVAGVAVEPPDEHAATTRHATTRVNTRHCGMAVLPPSISTARCRARHGNPRYVRQFSASPNNRSRVS